MTYLAFLLSSQLRELLEMDLPEDTKPLIESIRKFRDEELEHFDTSIENDAHQVLMP